MPATRTAPCSRRGSVLVHVLVVSIVVSMIAVGMLQILLTRYTLAVRATNGSQKRGQAQEILNRLLSQWNSGGFCTSPPLGGSVTITCSLSGGGPCSNCVCTVSGGGSISATGTQPNCSLTIITPP